jgi:hypothetical protein
VCTKARCLVFCLVCSNFLLQSQFLLQLVFSLTQNRTYSHWWFVHLAHPTHCCYLQIPVNKNTYIYIPGRIKDTSLTSTAAPLNQRVDGWKGFRAAPQPNLVSCQGIFIFQHKVHKLILILVLNPTALTDNKYPTIVTVLRLENKI